MFHAGVLAFGPRLVHEHPLEPPRVLSVLLPMPALVAEEVTPPAPPPPARRPPARPAPPGRPAPAATPRRGPAGRAGARGGESGTALADAGPKQRTARRGAGRPARRRRPWRPRPASRRRPPTSARRTCAIRRRAYPTAARRNGEEGTVTLRVLVSTEGAPREVMLERSSGSSSLDAAALATVKTWRFTPARRGGEAQEAWVLVPIVFRLEPRG